jgi:hypothetical protein
VKETPASLAEQILNAILEETGVVPTPRHKAELVNAILTVINPLCNEVAKLEEQLKSLRTEAQCAVAESYADGRRSILAEEAFDDAAG